jgi:negative regulator of sigma E activity
LKIYDKPFGAMDFEGLYGKKAEVLVNEWLTYVGELPSDTAKARTIFHNIKTLMRRK